MLRAALESSPRLRGWSLRAWWGLLGWVALSVTVQLDWLIGALTVSWSAHAAIPLLVAAGLQVRARAPRRAALSVLGAALGLAPWLPAQLDARAEALPPDARPLRLMVANTFYAPPRLDALTADLDAAGADLVALIEPPTHLPQHLANTGRWRVLAAHLPDDKNNIALIARAASLTPEGGLSVQDAGPWTRDYTPSVPLEARITWRGRPLHVVAAHPPAPTTRAQHAQRLRLVPELAARVQASGVLLVDLNATLASPLWRRVMQSGLRRPPGFTPATWPSWFGPLGVALDHALVTEGVRANPARVHWLTTSDHRGVVVEVLPAPEHSASARLRRERPSAPRARRQHCVESTARACPTPRGQDLAVSR